jgi:alkanesulfonate monooxygenase SsuD/methylene tetrahydromethanopterin reductase-like flavin-dependent oxidoreductase (luciferase family)
MERGRDGQSRRRVQGPLESDAGVPARHASDLGQRGAHFHGQFVNFDPIWSWPKPVQAGGPPVLLGVGATKAMPKRVVEYCSGWMPLDGLSDLAQGMASLRAEAARTGRSLEDFDLSVLSGFGGFEATGMEKERGS